MTHHDKPKDNNPKDHHYVPQAYLSHFTDDEGKLATIDLELSKATGYHRVTGGKKPKGIAFEKMFYLVNPDSSFLSEDVKGMQLSPYYVETQVFKRMENNYSRIVSQMLNHEIISNEKAIILSEALLLMKLRTKYHRESMKPDAQRLVDELTTKYITKLDELDVENKERKIEIAKYYAIKLKNDPELVKELHVGSLLHRSLKMNGLEKTIPLFLRHLKWNILVTDDNHQFITTDNPGYCIDLDTNTVQNMKFANRFIYCLPLNPNNCLVLTYNEFDIDYMKFGRYKEVFKQHASTKQVGEINSCSLRHIDRFIVSKNTGFLEAVIPLLKTVTSAKKPAH
jgi:hypothetical protein